MLTLILGGSASGKSAYAEHLAREPVLYVATGVATDPEMTARIARHRERRPASWDTIEEPLRVADLLSREGHRNGTILIDSITTLAANLQADAVRAEVQGIVSRAADTKADVMAVSDEVGWGVVPEHPAGRAFRDTLGEANRILAAGAQRVILVVAGIPLALKGDLP